MKIRTNEKKGSGQKPQVKRISTRLSKKDGKKIVEAARQETDDFLKAFHERLLRPPQV